MATFGLGDMQENKALSIGCIRRMLVLSAMAINNINFIQRKLLILRRMALKSKLFQLACITVLLLTLKANCTPGAEVNTVS